MNGPEHFQLAEKWARRANEVMKQIGALGERVTPQELLAGAAQVQNLLAAGTLHATLAKVAATVDAGTVVVPAAHQAWNAVLGKESGEMTSHG